MKPVIFYSWQSDLPSNVTRSFIQVAIEKALKSLRKDDVPIEAVMDRDTEGLTGAPDITQAIFSKIDDCQVFICDVSLINSKDAGKRTPNPNVLVELGYAAATIGWGQVILVANLAFGGIHDLPFDLKQRRIVAFDTSKAHEDVDRIKERDLLAGKLKSILGETLKASPVSNAIQLLFDNDTQEVTIEKPLLNDNSDQKNVLAQLVAPINLYFINSSKKSINDVDCVLTFPSSVIVHSEDSLKTTWEFYPDDVLSHLSDLAMRRFKKKTFDDVKSQLSRDWGFASFLCNFPNRTRKEPSYKQLLESNSDSTSSVRYKIGKIKPKLYLECKTFFVKFSSLDKVASFNISYTINADEVHYVGILKANIDKNTADIAT